MAEVTEGLVYRGHPLRRVDNLIYYGSMAERRETVRSLSIVGVWNLPPSGLSVR